jgi:CRP/FNR family transcriptional regulator, dissimilatory nitrate respiration regulator
MPAELSRQLSIHSQAGRLANAKTPEVEPRKPRFLPRLSRVQWFSALDNWHARAHTRLVVRQNSTMQSHAAILGACPVFSALPPRELEALGAIGLERVFDTGDYLFHQGVRAQGFYAVAAGRVRVHCVGADGREQILRVFGPGEICGEVPVFQGTTYPASAAATEPTRALYLPGDAFRRLARRYPDMLFSMLADLSLRLRRFVQLIDDLSLKEVSARLAKHLLDASVRAGQQTFTLATTKAMLAARIGTVPETLSRILRKMQKRRMIDVDGRSITILDRDALLDLAAGMKL